ncbi:MAG: hypothetical protein EBU90_09765 [Proteobacteria bacterium]|nr:hypothetical protein [Pseudomonadota bacterium]NBP14539.1 hypothetical protein [bacterium]
MPKLAIIGKGTAGALSIGHFLRYTDWEIDWYFDHSVKAQAVGEASTLTLPNALYQYFDITIEELQKHLDGNYKYGIRKKNWGTGKDFFHHFSPQGNVAYHFNAVKLQEYVFDFVQKSRRVKIFDQHVHSLDSIDADYIMNCSGKPKDFEPFHMSEYIPVNSVYVTQCYWDHPTFQYSLTYARKYGWVFGIPLQNRCSIGYLYNNTITSLEDVKEDVKIMFEDFNLVPSEDTNAFSFNNYYRKNNFEQDERVVYNGNASFFLEPLEATSIHFMEHIFRLAWDLWNGRRSVAECNQGYIRYITAIEHMIANHYYAGSIWDNQFWTMAKEKGKNAMNKYSENAAYQNILDCMKKNKKQCLKMLITELPAEYGQWNAPQFYQNYEGLGILDKVLNEFYIHQISPMRNDMLSALRGNYSV